MNDASDSRDQASKERRRADVFGDVLPDTTADERARETDEREDSDERLIREVPPHHA